MNISPLAPPIDLGFLETPPTVMATVTDEQLQSTTPHASLASSSIPLSASEDEASTTNDSLAFKATPIIASSCSCKEAEAKFARLKEQGIKVDDYHFNALMSVYGKYQPNKAGEIISRMNQEGLKPTVNTYNILLNAYAEYKNYEGSIELFHTTMVAANIAPDIVTINSMLKLLRNCHKISEAKKLYQEFVKEGPLLKPSFHTFNLMVNILSIFTPQEGLAFMKSEKVQPDICNTTNLIEQFEFHNQWDGLWSVYQEAHKEIKLNDKLLLSVLKSLFHLKKYTEVKDVYNAFLAAGGKIEANFADMAVALLLGCGDDSSAKNIYKQFFQPRINLGVEKDFLHFESLTSGVSYLAMLDYLDGKGKKTNPFSVFLSYHQGKREEFVRLLKKQNKLEWEIRPKGEILMKHKKL